MKLFVSAIGLFLLSSFFSLLEAENLYTIDSNGDFVQSGIFCQGENVIFYFLKPAGFQEGDENYYSLEISGVVEVATFSSSNSFVKIEYAIPSDFYQTNNSYNVEVILPPANANESEVVIASGFTITVRETPSVESFTLIDKDAEDNTYSNTDSQVFIDGGSSNSNVATDFYYGDGVFNNRYFYPDRVNPGQNSVFYQPFIQHSGIKCKAEPAEVTVTVNSNNFNYIIFDESSELKNRNFLCESVTPGYTYSFQFKIDPYTSTQYTTSDNCDISYTTTQTTVDDIYLEYYNNGSQKVNVTYSKNADGWWVGSAVIPSNLPSTVSYLNLKIAGSRRRIKKVSGTSECKTKYNDGEIFDTTYPITAAFIYSRNDPVPVLSISDESPAFCKDNDTPILISNSFEGSNNGMNPDSTKGMLKFRYETGDFKSFPSDEFIPSAYSAGTYAFKYFYNENNTDYRFCSQESETITLEVVPIPSAQTEFPEKACVGDEVIFTSPGAELEGASYLWSFGDGDSLNSKMDSRTFDRESAYSVSLKVTSKEGCIGHSDSKFINITSYPEIDFSYYGGCSGYETELVPSLLNSEILLESQIDTWKWSINGEEKVQKELIHTFNSNGMDSVTLSATSEAGCETIISRNIFIQPVVDVYNYFETFDDDIYPGWVASGQVRPEDNSSWLENDQFKNKAGVWATNKNRGSYFNSESSYLESPCFILENTIFPMLDLTIASETDFQADGVILEYSLNGGENWSKVGELGTGIGWYNAKNLLGVPGTDNATREGWTGKFDWQKASFQLDGIKFEQSQVNTPVKFRFAFGSNADNPIDDTLSGFAIDEFSIVERNRIMVIETFTNVHSSLYEQSNQYLNSFLAGKEDQVIDIRYHITDIQGDPVNQLNKADFSAKRLHYGIDVSPRTVFDGTFNKELNFPVFLNDFGNKTYDRRSLVSAPFNLELQKVEYVDSISLTARITKNITPEDFEGDLVLMVGLLQKSLILDGKEYKNVLRKFIPNAGGTTIERDWTAVDTVEKVVNFTWMTDYYSDLDLGADYRFVAYLFRAQDIEQTKEIVQGAFVEVEQLPPPNVITGIDNSLRKDNFIIYPNPARNSIKVKMPSDIRGKVQYEIYSLGGSLIGEGELRALDQSIVVRNYPAGVYYMKISSEDIPNPIIRRFSLIR
ncbi:PKD domain-containing protein [Mangrovivirga sp. M17]|uniref:PKD domain-containing protein n=1 Tax=Mangrovivirga halotolerans TaxID=2993936 RepID=A0ABT3RPT1_9BACT|nr:PKD domain-containing protein [Mangrovivirga halotolerans]MCX2743641.1 PKD domain-containing protein [Mangrovivirga halotolerans]